VKRDCGEWVGKRTLVTGATGFIGHVLCQRLQASGATVHALLRRDAEGPWKAVVRCELGDELLPAVDLGEVDTVFHLAGVAHRRGVSDDLYRRVNVEGTRNLLEAAVAAGVERFVYFSSVKAVADPPRDECVDESWDVPPSDAYGRSKREAESLVLEAGGRAGMHVVVIRPTLVYGPQVKGNLARIARLVASGWCPPLPDTSNRRSMVHVEDLCALALEAARNPAAAGGCFIAADAHPVSTRALYEGLCGALGRSVPRWRLPPGLLRMGGRAGDWAERLLRRTLPLDSAVVSRLLDSACYSGERAMRELGWRPRYDLLSSLDEMVATMGSVA